MLLIIDQHKKNADSVCEMFYFMGILSCGVTPRDAISEYSPIYKAILVTNPDGIPLIEDFIEKLRGYVGLTPIFSLSSKSEISKYRYLFADSFPHKIPYVLCIHFAVPAPQEGNTVQDDKLTLICKFGKIQKMI